MGKSSVERGLLVFAGEVLAVIVCRDGDSTSMKGEGSIGSSVVDGGMGVVVHDGSGMMHGWYGTCNKKKSYNLVLSN